MTRKFVFELNANKNSFDQLISSGLPDNRYTLKKGAIIYHETSRDFKDFNKDPTWFTPDLEMAIGHEILHKDSRDRDLNAATIKECTVQSDIILFSLGPNDNHNIKALAKQFGEKWKIQALMAHAINDVEKANLKETILMLLMLMLIRGNQQNWMALTVGPRWRDVVPQIPAKNQMSINLYVCSVFKLVEYKPSFEDMTDYAGTDVIHRYYPRLKPDSKSRIQDIIDSACVKSWSWAG